MKLLGYVRVSSVAGREGDGFISPRVQRERMAAWATACDHTVEFLPDELDQSGGKADRPVFQSALERCEAGDADGVIVAKLDRFARSVPDAAIAIRRLEAADCVLVSVADQLDTSTPVGRFARTMMIAIAELELERIRESWDTAKADAVRRGIHLATHPPVGYIRGDDRRLTPDPQTAPVVLEAFQLRAAGTPLAEIGRFMVEHGARSYAGGEWTGRAVSMMLRNRVYLGEARSGDYVNADAHPAIVPRPVWEAAQIARIVQAARSGDGYLLAGILRCAGCRYRMAGQKGVKNDVYRCKGRHAAGLCPCRAGVTVDLLDDYVTERFLARVKAGEMRAVASVSTEGIAEAGQLLAVAEADLAAYRDDPEILRVLGREAFVAGLEGRAEAVETARRVLGEEQASVSMGDGLPDSVTLLEAWPTLSTAERRQLLHAGIDAVMIESAGRRNVPVAERTVILWRGEVPDDLPDRGVFGPIKSFEMSGITTPPQALHSVA